MQFGFGLGLTHLRPASVNADPIAGLYGTGMGQIPLHLRAEDAALDGSGNVTGITNRGGAGPLFNATASATGMTRTGNLLMLPQTSYLTLQNPADLGGTRLFFVAKPDVAMDRYARILGNANPQNLIRPDKETGQFMLQRAGVAVYLAGSGSPIGTDPHLYEIEIAGGQAKLIVDGVQLSQVACAWTDFTVTMIGAAFSGAGYLGGLGDPLSVITDGTPSRDGTMLDVRRALAAKHGITLP